MARVVVHGADLMMYSRIEAALSNRGHEVSRTRAGQAVAVSDLALCDVEKTDPEAALELLRPAPILGYGSHDKPHALRRARQAGFERVVARSAIAERLPELVDELLATAQPDESHTPGATPR
jgi:hypothetical protein